MGFPLILFGLAPLVNSSFESDAGGAAPSGWDTAASVNGISLVSSAEFHSAGDGLPSARGLRQNTSSGTAGNKAIARQRVALPELLPIIREAGTEIALAAMFKPTDQRAADNATLVLEQYSGGTSAPGSGALLPPPFSRSFSCGEGNWVLRLAAAAPDPAAAWLDVVLRYDLTAGYNAASDAFWDRVFLGGLVDLHKGFRKIDPEPTAGYAANEGDGAVEIVRTRRPMTKLDLQLANIAHGCEDDLQLKALRRWLAGPLPGTLALWVDREQHTNAGMHYQRVYQDPKLKIEIPPGFLRTHYGFELTAPSEAA